MRLSVVVSTFNHSKYIAKAIDSVLRQQMNLEFEIIIGDDCSQDHTRDILKDYQRAWPHRIRLLLPSENLGGDGAGLLRALVTDTRGEFLAILDGDDEWTSPLKLQKQLDFLSRHPDCPLSFHNALVVYEGDLRPSHRLRPEGDDALLDVHQLLQNTCVQNSTLMLRRELLDEDRGGLEAATVRQASDWMMTVLAGKYGRVGYLGEALSLYRQHSGGWWSLSDRARQLALTVDQYEWLRSRLPAEHDREIARQIGEHAWALASEYERRRDFRQAASALARVLAERPEAFEEYLPGEGSYGKQVWRVIERRAWLYGHPGLDWLAWTIRRASPRVEDGWAAIREALRSRRRGRRGQSQGWITSTPQTSLDEYAGSMAVTELRWDAINTDSVEVTIGRPGGRVFSRSGAEGNATTGPWVHDRMLFCLQDVSGGLPPTAENTLATVRVKLPRERTMPRREAEARTAAVLIAGAGATHEPAAPGVEQGDRTPSQEPDSREIAAIVETLLGTPVSEFRPIGSETDCLLWEFRMGADRAIAKAGRSPDTSSVALEAWALSQARDLGVPVPRVLALDTTRRRLAADIMVLEYASGRPLSTVEMSGTDKDDLLAQLGQWVRVIHGVKLEGHGTLDESVFRTRGLVRGFFEQWKDAVLWHVDYGLPYLETKGLLDGLMVQSIRDLIEQRSDLLVNHEWPRLLHGDLGWTHVFVSDDGRQLTSLIDFGNRQAGDPAWEFARLSITEGMSALPPVLRGYDPDGAMTNALNDRIPFYRVTLGLAVGRWLEERGYSQDATRLMAEIMSVVAHMHGTGGPIGATSLDA
ncbi:MAG: glycosyltransferase [Ilumatobacteraceae bacterium]